MPYMIQLTFPQAVKLGTIGVVCLGEVTRAPKSLTSSIGSVETRSKLLKLILYPEEITSLPRWDLEKKL